jgi:hypothetical protein
MIWLNSAADAESVASVPACAYISGIIRHHNSQAVSYGNT